VTVDGGSSAALPVSWSRARAAGRLRRRGRVSTSKRGIVGHILATGLSYGCGGGLPLLHPAQTLPLGEVRAHAGFSGQVAAAGFSTALRDAQSDAAAGGLPGAPPGKGADATFAKGALVEASIGPGLAPVIGARVGLGNRFEGGLAYTGRAARADVRRSFELSRYWAISLEAAGSAALYSREAGQGLPNVDLGELHGWGADVPIVVGYASDGELYSLWLGPRAGWEEIEIGQRTATVGGMPARLSATRVWAGGLLGLAVGFRHIHVAMEIDASVARVAGNYRGTNAELTGLTLAPGAALWWTF
jgi:hypothetical protein